MWVPRSGSPIWWPWPSARQLWGTPLYSNTLSKALRHGLSSFQLSRDLLWGFGLGLEGPAQSQLWRLTCLDSGNDLAGSVDCSHQLCPAWDILKGIKHTSALPVNGTSHYRSSLWREHYVVKSILDTQWTSKCCFLSTPTFPIFYHSCQHFGCSGVYLCQFYFLLRLKTKFEIVFFSLLSYP